MIDLLTRLSFSLGRNQAAVQQYPVHLEWIELGLNLDQRLMAKDSYNPI